MKNKKQAEQKLENVEVNMIEGATYKRKTKEVRNKRLEGLM